MKKRIPVSSRSSLIAACSKDSPFFTPPTGVAQYVVAENKTVYSDSIILNSITTISISGKKSPTF